MGLTTIRSEDRLGRFGTTLRLQTRWVSSHSEVQRRQGTICDPNESQPETHSSGSRKASFGRTDLLDLCRTVE